ncbi:MAG: DUF4136 domain-containing protein [Gammaproteobacteria bacterium]|nr:DUF4136 domain-containing protein [Gammaproteobacteria bacterium]MDH4311254.1 DUF4136 domain-containing protein [Gammaproteobacteria bacterium]
MFARLFRTIVVAAAVAGFAAGCASPPPQPETMRDPGVNFTNFKTFGWTAGGAVDAGDAPLKLLDANIRAAIVDVMKRKGYVEAPAGTTPDLRMAYETASAEKLENNPVRVGIGVGSWGGNVGGSVSMGSPSVRNFTEGTLVVHAIDTARNAEVWQGRVSGKMTKGSVESSAINQAVARAMADFPVR